MILDAYSSILGQDDYAESTDSQKKPGRLHSVSPKSTHVSASRAGLKQSTESNGPTSDLKQHESQSQESDTSNLPDFVLRARKEIANADYIRNHDEFARPAYLRDEPSDAVQSTASDPNTDRRQAEPVQQAVPQRQAEPAGQSRTAAAAQPTRASKATPASLQSLIMSAVQKALAATDRQGPGSQQVKAWQSYLDEAQAAREKLAAASAAAGAGGQGALRRAQVSVLEKRVQQAEQLLARVEAARSTSAAAAPEASGPGADAPDSDAYGEMRRQGLLPRGGAGGPPPAETERARLEGRSLFRQEEEHLSQEVDSIFGPGPSPAAAAAVTAGNDRGAEVGEARPGSEPAAAADVARRPARDRKSVV